MAPQPASSSPSSQPLSSLCKGMEWFLWHKSHLNWPHAPLSKLISHHSFYHPSNPSYTGQFAALLQTICCLLPQGLLTHLRLSFPVFLFSNAYIFGGQLLNHIFQGAFSNYPLLIKGGILTPWKSHGFQVSWGQELCLSCSSLCPQHLP